MRPPQTVVRGSRWELDVPGGNKITVDPNLARQEAMEKAQYQIANLDLMLAKAKAAHDTIQENQLAAMKSWVVVGLPDFMKMHLQKLATEERIAGQQIQSREKVAAERNATTLKVAEMRRKKGGGGLYSGRPREGETAYQRMFRTLGPTKAATIARLVNIEMRTSLKHLQWDVIGQTSRLDIAERMLEEGGSGEVEALLNFYGYVRRGVPAENESKQWMYMTSTARTFLNRIGMKLHMGQLGELAMREDLTEEQKDELRHKYTGLPEDQRIELRRAIQKTREAMNEYVETCTNALGKHFAGRAPEEQELAQAKIDELREWGGLPPKSYFGRKPGQPSAVGEGAGGAPKPSVADTLRQVLGEE